MRMIKWASDVIADNINEAHHYMVKAFEIKDECEQAAEWCKEMAEAHLRFNDAGHNLVTKLINDFKSSGKNSELAPGMLAVYQDKHADAMKKTAEVNVMIQMFR